MGLSAAPITRLAIPRKVPLFTMPWAGAITRQGKVYGIGYPITAVDTMAYWNVWDDPTHLEAYRNLPLVDQGKIFGSALDETNKKIYVGPYYSGAPRTARIWQWDLVTEQLTVLVNDVALGIGAPSQGTQSGLCTDGTYVYAVLFTNIGTNSWVFKFRISDGTLVSKIQMTNPTIGSGNGATRIELVDSTHLVVVGLGNGWVALVPTDLSTVTTITQPEGSNNSLFGCQCVQGFAWIGSYVDTKLYRYSSDLTSLTVFDYSAYAGSSNPVFDLRWDDGEYIWVALKDYTVLGINIDTGACEFVFPQLRTLAPGPTGSTGWKIGMIWPLPQGIALGDSVSAADQTSFGYWIEYGTAPNAPRELARGVGGRR